MQKLLSIEVVYEELEEFNEEEIVVEEELIVETVGEADLLKLSLRVFTGEVTPETMKLQGVLK